MDLNPYASPVPAERSRARGLGRLLLRFVAICLWLASLFLVLGIVTNWNRPEITARSAQNPILAAVIWVVGFVLPAVGFALLGFASWRRRWTLALIGVASFIPLLLFLLFF